jgi:predicted DNA-binding protein (MmcQ/YjbR family)
MVHPTIVAVGEQCMALRGTTVDNTFGDDTDVYRVGDKMFALVNVRGGDTVTLKVNPEEGEALRQKYESVTPGYYMNKRHWVTVDVTGDLPVDELAELIVESRRLVFASLTKAKRVEIEG